MWEWDRLSRPIAICCWKFSIYSTRFSLCCASDRDKYPSCMCTTTWLFYLARGLQYRGHQVRTTYRTEHTSDKLANWHILLHFNFRLGGQGWLFGLLNCFVHFVMYGYYFGSVYRPKLKQNIFLKKSITQLQIVSDAEYSMLSTKMKYELSIKHSIFQVQFILTIIHLSIPLVMDECGYPKAILSIGISQNIIMLMLFCDFYYNAYIKPSKIKKSTWICRALLDVLCSFLNKPPKSEWLPRRRSILCASPSLDFLLRLWDVKN